MLRHELVAFLLGLGTLLAASRLFGELAARLRQPMVLGEMVAGFLLGPALLGAFFPNAQAILFPATGNVSLAWEGFIAIALILFLLMEGMNIDIRSIREERKASLAVAFLGLAIPMVLGFALAYLAPGLLSYTGNRPMAFALFFGTALAISSLNIINRILKDHGLFRQDVGIVTHAAAVTGDLAGWLVLAATLSLFRVGSAAALPAWVNFLLALGFAALVMTLGRFLIDRIVPFIHAHATWPAASVGFVLALTFTGAAFSQWLGVHALFGALLVGVAMGGSPHLLGRTRVTLERTVYALFTPVLFAYIALSIKWVGAFHLGLTLLVFGLAVLVKVGAGLAGSLWGGLGLKEGILVGIGINARGSINVLLAFVALKFGLIGESLFIALALTALGTSSVAGPLVRLISGHRIRRFWTYFGPKAFVHRLSARTPEEALDELAKAAGAHGRFEMASLAKKARDREKRIPSGVLGEVAIAHMTLPGVKQPVVAAGISTAGLDFQASDRHPARAIFLVVVPEGGSQQELEILEEISDTFLKPGLIAMATEARNYTEFLAVLKTSSAEHG